MSIDAAGYMSTAMWVANARNGGGTYDPESWGYPWRIVLHTIEGSTSVGLIAGHPAPPHLWYNPATRALYQTVPFSRSGFALYQSPGGVHYTNKARALQVEIAGFAAEAASWPQEWLNNLAVDVIVPICQWVASVGASINLLDAPEPGPIPGSAANDAPQRFNATRWATFNGLCSHRHVWSNGDRWDTGGLDTPRLAQHAALIVGGLISDVPGRTPTLEDDDMSIIVQLNEPADPQHGSLWAVDGLFKRRINSMEEYERLLASGSAKKQADGSGWAQWSIDQLRPLTTIEEFSMAGMPQAVASAVGGAVANMGAQIAQQVASTQAQLVAAVGPQIAQAMRDAVAPQIAQAMRDAVAPQITQALQDAMAELARTVAATFTGSRPPLRSQALANPLTVPIPTQGEPTDA